MDVIGVIAEYNPFHNGHLYQINKIKEIFPNSTIVAIITGYFSQRGDSSLINKWDKCEIAIKNGVDLVVELPFKYSVQSADTFAYAAIKLLNELKINYLVFGSESNDTEKLKITAQAQLSETYQNLIKEELKKGINYPTALNNALLSITKEKIDTPNDILALSYIREIIKQKANITPISIKRTNNYHDINLNDTVTSASSIRENILKKDITKYVPKNSVNYLKTNLSFIENYFPYLKYKIISEIDSLDKYLDVDEGIENKIKKVIYKSNSLDELINNTKSKRYTYSKLKRMCIHILTSFTKEENENKALDYIRILGFNSKGQRYLNKIKKEINIDVYTKFNKNLEYELKIANIYSIIFDNKYKDEIIKKEITGLIKLT